MILITKLWYLVLEQKTVVENAKNWCRREDTDHDSSLSFDSKNDENANVNDEYDNVDDDIFSHNRQKGKDRYIIYLVVIVQIVKLQVWLS